MRVPRWAGLVLGVIVLAGVELSAKQSLMQEPGPDRLINGRSGLGGGSSTQRFVRRYPLEAAGVVTVDNIRGDIRVEAWDRAEAEVTVVKESAGGAATSDGVRVDVETDGKRLGLRTLYPPESENPVRVSYHLRVPRQIRLERLSTMAGSIHVRNVEGSVGARTLNGSIEEVNVSGKIHARSLNGNISVSMRSLGGRSEPVQLETVNGHLYLGLPGNASAALSLATVAGRLDCSFALQASDRPGDASWRAVLGPGGTPVRLRTVRGNIQVAQSSEVL